MNESRTTRFPLGAAVRLVELGRDPYPILADLRTAEPVTWVPEVNMWFLTRRTDIATVLHDPETFTVDHPGSVIADMFGRHMMTTDGPDQVRQKRACMGHFKPRFLEAHVRPRVESIVANLLAGIDHAVEFRETVTRPLAVRTVAAILGFPQDDVDDIGGWYVALADALANFTGDASVRARGKQAVDGFAHRVRELIAGAGPDDGLLGYLARSHDGFDEPSIISNALIIMFGGIETTDGMMSNALWALLSHPDQYRAVRQEPDLLRNAVDETLRWEPSVQSCTRCATRNVEINGVLIRTGETVQCMLGAANRDPATFQEPDRFDIRRHNARDHLSFGAGRHFCLGAPLAYLETETLLQELFRRFRQIALDTGRPTTLAGYEFRKPQTLWLLLEE